MFPELTLITMPVDNTQKMKSPIKDFFSKCDQIHSFLRIWSHLLKKSLMENFIFFVVRTNTIVMIILMKAQSLDYIDTTGKP